jgi:hypothetical protein
MLILNIFFDIIYIKLNTTTYLIKTNSMALASKLYRPSDRRLSAKLVPTLADRGVAWLAHWIPRAVNFGFLDRNRYFPFK